MLVEKYKEFLPDYYSDEEKEKIIKDLYILSELIIDSEDLSKIINTRWIGLKNQERVPWGKKILL